MSDCQVGFGSAGAKGYLVRAVRGFTLVEMLVVLAILGIVSLTVGISVNRTTGGASRQEAQRLGATLESLWLEARVSGRRFLWRGEQNSYRWSEKNPRLDIQDRFPLGAAGQRDLDSAGLHIVGVSVESRALAANEAIELGPLTPMFQIELAATGQRYVLRSMPTGKMVISEPEVTFSQ